MTGNLPVRIGAVLLFGSMMAHSNASNKSHINFIVIMADDLGYADIGCFGNTQIKTPNLDRMSKEGVRFVDFHSNGAVCSPTRAALLTGKYQQRTGIEGVITAKDHREAGLALSETTFAEALNEKGYATGIFGKWHLGYDPKYNPVNQGFDEFSGYVSGNVDYHSHVDQEGHADWWKGNKLENEAGYSTNLIAKNASDFMTRHQEQPFVLYIAHEAPHSPYQGLKSKADRFPGAKNGVDFPVQGTEKNISAIYTEMIEILDAGIGETLNTLKQLKLDKNTIVIFCSDNGAPKPAGSNGILRGFKGSAWEGGHRVPAIIRWPDHIKPGWISTETALTMDIFPTLCDLAGIAKPEGIDGVSLASHLLHQTPLDSRTLFWDTGKSTAVRKGKWKLVLPEQGSKPELYDLEKDTEEKVNVAGQNPVLVHELFSELNAWKVNVKKGVKKIS